MNISDIKFRNEREEDYRTVEELTREAFWNLHVPGCDEHYLVHILRNADCFIKELDIVAELDNKIVANIMYTKAKIAGDDGVDYPVITFGPVSVWPSYQGMGIGKKIIEHTKKIAKNLGYTAIFIYGDPKFYNKVGFVASETYGIGTAYKTYTPALQACELVEGVLTNCKGLFIEDVVYNINAEDSKDFDRNFNEKKYIEGLPSQKKFAEAIKNNKPRQK